MHSAGVAVAPVEVVAERIFIVRGHKAILDADLAALYEVPTKPACASLAS